LWEKTRQKKFDVSDIPGLGKGGEPTNGPAPAKKKGKAALQKQKNNREAGNELSLACGKVIKEPGKEKRTKKKIPGKEEERP